MNQKAKNAFFFNLCLAMVPTTVIATSILWTHHDVVKDREAKRPEVTLTKSEAFARCKASLPLSAGWSCRLYDETLKQKDSQLIGNLIAQWMTGSDWYHIYEDVSHFTQHYERRDVIDERQAFYFHKR